MALKRDNWTTEEVIKIIEGRKLYRPNGNLAEFQDDHNAIVDDVVDAFRGFQTPQEQFGALAYDTETGFIVHIGEIPEEMKIEMGQRRRSRKKD